MREFELFILRKYNGGDMDATDYAKINMLLGEFKQEQDADHEDNAIKLKGGC